ncbi:MAG: type II secretion system F family protein [Planctomycetes bacterium]|nr:type II secretion system F family protein [Planctomycetota bacterium]
MPDFAYIARDLSGNRVSGKLTAATAQEALSMLGQKALFPVQVEAEKSSAVSFLPARRIKAQLMATTFGQLADLLRSGVPLLRSLDVVQRQSSNERLTAVLAEVRGRVEEGASLAEAMARHPRVFSEMAISMVRAGGEGGFLEDALDHVADFTEKQEDIKSRTLGALAYPGFLSVVGTLVVTGLIVFIVPKFEVLFARLKERGELPIFTEWLLALSNLLQHWGLLILGLLIAGVVYLKMKLATEAGRLLADRLKLRVPLAGTIFLNMAVARFCRVLGTLLKNGVPILRSLQISNDATGNRVLSAAIRDASENISSGEALASPLAACGHFPPAVVEMIAVAEESNTLEKVLTDIAEGLERRTWRQLDLFVRLLEPLMLLVLAAVVLVVVIALLLPVIKMSTTVG